MTMSIGERAEAIRRAKHALALLGARRTTSKERLGAAREHLTPATGSPRAPGSGRPSGVSKPTPQRAENGTNSAQNGSLRT